MWHNYFAGVLTPSSVFARAIFLLEVSGIWRFVSLWRMANARNFSFETLHGGQFTILIQLIKPNYVGIKRTVFIFFLLELRQPLVMGWNFSSFKTLKDNTYTFYCVFDSALNQKHNKQKAYPYPPSLRWDFQRKRAVKFCGVDFSEFLSFWKIKNQQNLQQNRTCKVFMLHDLHSVQVN